MRKNSKNIGFIIFIGILIIAASTFSIYEVLKNDEEKEPFASEESIDESAITENRELLERGEVDSNQQDGPVVQDDNEDAKSTDEKQSCISINDFIGSENWQLWQGFYQKWGFPYESIDPEGNPYIERHAYQDYKISTLKIMAKNYDPQAYYVLGLKLIWIGLGGEGEIPFQPGDTFLEKLPSGTVIEPQTLEEGRTYLKQAGIAGHMYSYIDLAMSYSYELTIKQRRNNLTEEERQTLLKSIYQFGHFPAHIIPELGKNLFNSEVPEEYKGREEEVLNQFKSVHLAKREEKGYGELEITPAPKRLELVFCEYL